jgi:hypothetical protein
MPEILVALTGPLKGIEPIEFLANQDNDEFPSQPPENVVNDRHYPSAVKLDEWDSWGDEKKTLTDELCDSLLLKCDYAALVDKGARAA